MNIPPWLAGLTGANAYATNFANDFQPTVGDALQGIGSSMKRHYLAGTAPQQQPQGVDLMSILSGLGGQGQPQPGPAAPAIPTPAPPVAAPSPQAPLGNWTGPFDPRANSPGFAQSLSGYRNPILRGLG